MRFEVADEIYDLAFDEAATTYNELAMEAMERVEGKKEDEKLSDGDLKRQRRFRHENRRKLRELRAERRVKKWVQNVEDDQYAAIKGNVEIGQQPFIHAFGDNPFGDLFVWVPVHKLLQPIDNCAMCQYPLNEVEENGGPFALPCKHMFHLQCLEELFEKRSEEEEVFKCPLCNVWFRDVREMPVDFCDHYFDQGRDFDSNASSSVLSATDNGDETRGPPPPWLFDNNQLKEVPKWDENTIERRPDAVTGEAVQDSLDPRSPVEIPTSADESLPQQTRRRGRSAIANHNGTILQAIQEGVREGHGPEVTESGMSEVSSAAPTPPSAEIEDESLLETGDSVFNTSPPPLLSARAPSRKRQPPKGREEPSTRKRRRP